MTLGEKICQRRKELGLSLAEVGQYVGVSAATVCRWESGIIQNARTDKLEKLAMLLHLNPVEMALAIVPNYDGPVITPDEAFGDLGAPVPPDMRVLHRIEISKNEYDKLCAYRNAPENIRSIIDLALTPYIKKD